MANYDSVSGVESVIDAAVAGGGLSAAVGAAITGILADLAAGVSPIAQFASTVTTAVADTVNAAVVMPEEGVRIDATFDAESPVQAVVAADGADNNTIIMQTDKDVAVTLSGGEGDNVETGSGSDAIEFRGGSATINTGSGNDTVVMRGGAGDNVKVVSGDGSSLFSFIKGFAGNATIDGGDGFDRVNHVEGKGHGANQHWFEVVNGKFVMHSEGNIELDDINVVTFDTVGGTTDNPGDGIIDDVTVLASTAGESLIARLYQVGLNRSILDGANGIGADGQQVWLPNGLEATAANNQLAGFMWWTEEAGASKSDADLLQLTERFVSTTEFQEKIGSLGSAAEQVAKMYANLGATDSAANQAELVQGLQSGELSLAEVTLQIAMSNEATTILGLEGSQYVIDGF